MVVNLNSLMKLQRTPLILLTIAVLLGAGVYLYEQGNPQREAAQEQAKQVFSFKEDEVQELTLKTPQHTLSFRQALAVPASQPSQKAAPASPQPQSSTWRMTAPNSALANEASVAYLLNLLTTAKSEQPLTVPATKQPEFGFDAPLATVDVKLKDQKQHRLVLGKPNFDRSAMYAQADPAAQPNADLSVLLVPMEFENAVSRPLAEWQQLEKPNIKPGRKSK
ncbi:MAG: DUF4340 domain-containing protein [Leptolyngbyaceae cyanobacterium RU_5_1]|nr:DUF4340 domain-containing protein [Leptolyngbyaceae cyanobacterium RU_5_1]